VCVLDARTQTLNIHCAYEELASRTQKNTQFSQVRPRLPQVLNYIPKDDYVKLRRGVSRTQLFEIGIHQHSESSSDKISRRRIRLNLHRHKANLKGDT